jgi:hypothetical protein
VDNFVVDRIQTPDSEALSEVLIEEKDFSSAVQVYDFTTTLDGGSVGYKIVWKLNNDGSTNGGYQLRINGSAVTLINQNEFICQGGTYYTGNPSNTNYIASCNNAGVQQNEGFISMFFSDNSNHKIYRGIYSSPRDISGTVDRLVPREHWAYISLPSPSEITSLGVEAFEFGTTTALSSGIGVGSKLKLYRI